MRSFFYILILLITTCFQAFAQVSERSNADAQNPDNEVFQTLLDSAIVIKKNDVEGSIDLIAQALGSLSDQGDERERALAFTTLGDVYRYHQQLDLAISSYQDAQAAYKTSRTALLLAQALIQNQSFEEAEAVLRPLIDIKGMVPYQRIQLFEGLGDAFAGRENPTDAILYYEEGLVIARKNRISPKILDLNSKIADAYAQDNRFQEAEAYYGYSLEQATGQAPKRAVREREKVADFYNRENRFEDEIRFRKKSLSELEELPATSAGEREISVEHDSITAQQINYKIANAYIAQDKYDEAISYLVESIKEAEDEDDLEVKKDATRSLSEVYREKGDFTKALETYQQYVAVVDTLYIRKEQEMAQAARFNREIAEKQNRINSLESDRELSQSRFDLAVTKQKLIEETNRRQKWVIYSLLLLTLFTALAAFFFYRSNRQQKLANNLSH